MGLKIKMSEFKIHNLWPTPVYENNFSLAEDGIKYIKNVTYESSIKKCIEDSDLIIIHTEWNDFKSINFKNLAKKKKFIIYDMRNIYSNEKIKVQGLKYFSVGS